MCVCVCFFFLNIPPSCSQLLLIRIYFIPRLSAGNKIREAHSLRRGVNWIGPLPRGATAAFPSAIARHTRTCRIRKWHFSVRVLSKIRYCYYIYYYYLYLYYKQKYRWMRCFSITSFYYFVLSTTGCLSMEYRNIYILYWTGNCTVYNIDYIVRITVIIIMRHIIIYIITSIYIFLALDRMRSPSAYPIWCVSHLTLYLTLLLMADRDFQNNFVLTDRQDV